MVLLSWFRKCSLGGCTASVERDSPCDRVVPDLASHPKAPLFLGVGLVSVIQNLTGL